MTKKHRHAAKSEWCPFYGETVDVGIRKGLTVGLLREYQHHYPPGPNAHGCCTSYRFSIVVHGKIVTDRDAAAVVRAIAKLHAQGKASDASRTRKGPTK